MRGRLILYFSSLSTLDPDIHLLMRDEQTVAQSCKSVTLKGWGEICILILWLLQWENLSSMIKTSFLLVICEVGETSTVCPSNHLCF